MTHPQEIQKYLITVESATLQEIYDNVTFSYYHNWAKYLGETLSRMVKSGAVLRVKKGVYKSKYREKQGDLFQKP